MLVFAFYLGCCCTLHRETLPLVILLSIIIGFCRVVCLHMELAGSSLLAARVWELGCMGGSYWSAGSMLHACPDLAACIFRVEHSARHCCSSQCVRLWLSWLGEACNVFVLSQCIGSVVDDSLSICCVLRSGFVGASSNGCEEKGRGHHG